MLRASMCVPHKLRFIACVHLLPDEEMGPEEFLAAQGTPFMMWNCDQVWRYLQTKKVVQLLLGDVSDDNKRLLQALGPSALASVSDAALEQLCDDRVVAKFVRKMVSVACNFGTCSPVYCGTARVVNGAGK